MAVQYGYAISIFCKNTETCGSCIDAHGEKTLGRALEYATRLGWKLYLGFGSERLGSRSEILCPSCDAELAARVAALKAKSAERSNFLDIVDKLT